jgi:hypothetical protein
MKAKLINYSCMAANIAGEYRHPQIVMRELGIVWQQSVPQSAIDSWEFWDCENLPENLPEFLSE